MYTLFLLPLQFIRYYITEVFNYFDKKRIGEREGKREREGGGHMQKPAKLTQIEQQSHIPSFLVLLLPVKA